ncbi:glycerophosphodiester phosphodiesterase [Peribacillus alkalitolerans]|uniref:glycerophosphodiester phosphodiesterase n=1 Tax=Peribacillus alkalitolerans TaxID=1550385 RepID=UPI0013D7172F|nr:glycerophosphodiester phosphodiesterase family protein [Peribacillus alkalitolerans]
MDWFLIGLAALLVLYIFAKKRTDKNVPLINSPIVIAHRGSSGACPENTYSAFDQAVEAGAEMIELDIQLSKDGELMVIHDRLLDRTTNGQGNVADYTRDELLQLDAGAWFDAKFSEEKIPVLQEVLERYNGKIGFLIEVKYPQDQPGIGTKLRTTLQNFLETKEGNHPLIVQSFDDAFLRDFNKMMSNIQLGLLIRKQLSLKEVEHFSTHISYLNPKYTVVTPGFIKIIHKHGMKCFVWTVRSKRIKEIIQKMNVDGIATDYPEWYK